MGPGFRPEFGCGASPRPVRLAGQRLRRRPDKCDAGCRPSGRRIPRPAASGRTRSLCRSSSSHRNRFAGFRREPCWGGNKNSRFAFFRHFYVGEILLPSGRCGCVGTTRRGVYFSRKNGFLRVGALRRRTRCSLLNTVLFWHFCVGGGITTLGVCFMPLKHWTRRSYGGLFAVFMPPRNLPCVGRISPSAGTHATPAPNRAHSGSHAETRRVLRVDGDDVSGSGIIDTIDPFQADQTVAVALAEGHRNAVSP